MSQNALLLDSCASGRAVIVQTMGAILIVEDDDDIRGLTAHMLQREGYDVLEAEHGERALEILDEQPHAAVPDSPRPDDARHERRRDATGTRALEQSERLASLPVVVVSAGGRPEDVPEGAQVRAQAAQTVAPPCARRGVLRALPQRCRSRLTLRSRLAASGTSCCIVAWVLYARRARSCMVVRKVPGARPTSSSRWRRTPHCRYGLPSTIHELRLTARLPSNPPGSSTKWAPTTAVRLRPRRSNLPTYA